MVAVPSGLASSKTIGSGSGWEAGEGSCPSGSTSYSYQLLCNTSCSDQEWEEEATKMEETCKKVYQYVTFLW